LEPYDNERMKVNRIDMDLEYDVLGKSHRRYGLIPMKWLIGLSPFVKCNVSDIHDCNDKCIAMGSQLIKPVGHINKNTCMFRFSDDTPKCVCIKDRPFDTLCGDEDYYCGCCLHPHFADQFYGTIFIVLSVIIISLLVTISISSIRKRYIHDKMYNIIH